MKASFLNLKAEIINFGIPANKQRLINSFIIKSQFFIANGLLNTCNYYLFNSLNDHFKSEVDLIINKLNCLF